MSNISSNSLFHFTSNFANLQSILENGFYPRISLESVKLSSEKNREGMGQSIPMTCFCDISLSQIHNHISQYGQYGIGMTKSWGIRNKLNPVIYLNPDSKLSTSFSQLADSIYDLLGEHCTKTTEIISDEFMNISHFIKQYDGLDTKDNCKEIRFYNEKEWRFVPEMSFEVGREYSLSIEEFKKEEVRQDLNEKLKAYTLDFTAKDIKYIFISKEEEIHDIINHLKKSAKFSEHEIEILITKILTVEQIKEDF